MLALIFIAQLAVAFANHTNTIDLAKCKVTHLGTEYAGRKSLTESNETCQFWSSTTVKGAKELADDSFPDGSKRLAKNYCRNPNRDKSGPWCYTSNKRILRDSCRIPLCKTKECRITGPGMEYAGSISKSASGKECARWKKSHNVKGRKKEAQLKREHFPEGSLFDAGKTCRNPDGNISGPWCYVESDESKFHEVELCDVPFCDDVDPVMYSEGGDDGRYFFFSSFNDTDSIKLDFRLWDAADWSDGKLYVLVSGLDVFGNGSEIKRWNSAIEMVLSNAGSGIINVEDSELRPTRDILSGVVWNTIEVTWVATEDEDMLVQVFLNGALHPIFMTEVELKGTVAGETSFRYLSLSGSRALWNISSDNEDCPVHTSPLEEFTRYWLMKKTMLGIDVDVFVRAVGSAVILFRASPATDMHQVQMVIADNGVITVSVYGDDEAFRVVKQVSHPRFLDFWKWINLKISFLKDRLQVYWNKAPDLELVVDVTHPALARVLWISVASPLTSYWTIDCDPRGESDPPAAVPPECVANEKDEFNGTLSVTSAGHQCIPWVDDDAIPEDFRKAELFARYDGRAKCQNFCRNLNLDPKGAFCFVRKELSEEFVLEYCNPRPCHLGDCKLAGTANDYTGRKNETRTKRSCDPWTEHPDDPYVTVTNFPDPSLEDAGNYCRNPSKNVGGPWCYTRDPEVPHDFCFVKDCDKDLECTVLATRLKRGHLVYILPSWRKHGLKFWLKTWNPDIYEGLRIKMLSMNRDRAYTLFIGDDANEKLKFYYSGFGDDEKLLVHKTLLHLVPAGKWGGFWLRPGRGKVELGYVGVRDPFFEWTSKDDDTSFDPAFLDFGTIQGHWIGVNFECTECLLERTTSEDLSRLYPIGLWRPEASKYLPSKLVLNVRGSGWAGIVFMSNPDLNAYMVMRFNSAENKISVWEFRMNEMNRKLATYDTPLLPLVPDTWTEYELSFEEKKISLLQNKVEVFEWDSRRHLLFYWFSVEVYEGTLIWSANCPPGDIDGPPRNGHWGAWGPWACSVTCGGGQGKTQRKCDSPPPNVFGRECKGSDVYEGPCNTFPCGDISPATIDLIRWHLSKRYTALEIEAGKKIVLACNGDVTRVLRKEVKKMNITWTLNGFPFSKRRARMDENYGLVLPKVSEQDNGVYLCVVQRDPMVTPSKVVIDVVSLVVNRTMPTKKIRKGRSLSLKCNGLALSYVYGDLSQKWEINGTVIKDYGITTLETVNTDKADNVSEVHDGIWTCAIVQQDLGFKWKTNWMHIRVKSAPNFWTHLTEDSATAPIFGRIENEKVVKAVFYVIVLLVLATAVVPVALVMWYLRPRSA